MDNSDRKYCIIFLEAIPIILNNNNKKYYVYCNAARKDAVFNLKDDKLSNEKYFSQMFLEQNTDSRELFSYTRASKQLKPYLPTNEQAEILYNGIIPTKYINKIVFKNNEDLEFLKHNLENKDIITNFNLQVDDLFFKTSRDKIQWEDR